MSHARIIPTNCNMDSLSTAVHGIHPKKDNPFKQTKEICRDLYTANLPEQEICRDLYSANQPKTKKNIQLVQEPVVLSDGSTMKPIEVKSSSDVLRASLLMLFKHVSDIHVTLVEIIAEKYGHSVEDIHKSINEDPRWAAMFTNPLITDLTATVEEHKVPKANTVATKPKRSIKILEDEPELVF